MILRRAFYYWQFVAVAVLPLWLVVGAALYGAGGWEVLGVTLSAIALGAALLIVALLMFARREVRAAKALSWPDVGVLTIWHALVIGLGLNADASPWLAVLAVLVGIGAFWFAIWELYDSARRRVQGVMDYLDVTAAGPSSILVTETTIVGTDTGFTRPVDPNVLVVTEKPGKPDKRENPTGAPGKPEESTVKHIPVHTDNPVDKPIDTPSQKPTDTSTD